jgi:regulator of protease activity HflC (stomatin/prohibitin superfamily)
MITAIADIPVDDRDQSFLFTGRTSDFQDVGVQGAITYRVVDPELAARRIDFGVDLNSGAYLQEPMERLAQLVSQTAQQLALDWIAHRRLDVALREAVQDLRPLLEMGLADDPALADVGLQVTATRVTRVAPNPELERALQAPTRERMQQAADEATFSRRALAVEKERAIAENELANQIELEHRREQLIAQEGANRERMASDAARATRIEAESHAERTKLAAAAKAEGIRLVEDAQVDAERERTAIYRDLPTQVLWSLTARELAGNLGNIDHLSVGSDGFAGMLQSLMAAGTRRLEE